MNARHERVEELAAVRPGYTIRPPERGATLLPYRVLQIKDITPDGRINPSTVSTTFLPELSNRYLVLPGEVILSARGTRNQAAVYKGDFDKVVAGAQFWVIRPNPTRILPEYLAWYINQPVTQQYFASMTHGTYIAMIQKEAVMKLAVPVPSLDVQQRIVTVHDLAIREQDLMARLAKKRAELVNMLCREVAEGLSTGRKQ
jgi:hypothetical protein